MKGCSYALALLLLLCVLSSGCLELQFMGFGWIFEVNEPAGSACESPTVKVANAVMKAGSGDESEGGIDKDHCYQAVAVNVGDTELCEKIERAAPRSKCYLLIADKYSDPRICSQMPAQLESGDSYSQIECIQTVAIKIGDSSICDQIGDRKISRVFTGEVSRDSCKRHVASGGTAGRSI